MQLWIPILNKIISYQFLLVLLEEEQIMNSHHKIISQQVVLPLKYGRIFGEKNLSQLSEV